MPQRVTQSSVELSTESTSPPARVTQSNIELSTESTSPPARVTQASVEISTASALPEVLVTQVAAAVLIYANSAHVWSHATFGGFSFPAGGKVSLDPPPTPPVTILSPFSGGRISGFKPEPGEADLILRRLEMITRRWAERIHPQQFRAPGSGLRGLSSHQEPLWHHDSRIRVRKPFLFQKSVVTPAPSSGDVQVISFEVPEGFFGVLTGYGWQYTGTGYLQGSSDIYWRLRIGLWSPSGLGQVAFMLGDPRDPFKTGATIPLRPRQKVALIVRVNNDSGLIQVGASYILAALCGWFYEPHREYIQ